MLIYFHDPMVECLLMRVQRSSICILGSMTFWVKFETMFTVWESTGIYVLSYDFDMMLLYLGRVAHLPMHCLLFFCSFLVLVLFYFCSIWESWWSQKPGKAPLFQETAWQIEHGSSSHSECENELLFIKTHTSEFSKNVNPCACFMENYINRQLLNYVFFSYFTILCRYKLASKELLTRVM